LIFYIWEILEAGPVGHLKLLGWGGGLEQSESENHYMLAEILGIFREKEAHLK